ncbi:DUF397 domain-containing protein [Actinokineospora sp.]|uniref:DUF397 domain-containing protein n=1 Tax=Actinokineospora sp. TaxID=1872133 RepID=UPI0040383133
MDVSAAVRWRRSSRSTNNQNCVEVADLNCGRAVRDSKHPTGPMLIFDLAAFGPFLNGVQGGRVAH